VVLKNATINPIAGRFFNGVALACETRKVVPIMASAEFGEPFSRHAVELASVAQGEPHREEYSSGKPIVGNMFDTSWPGPLLWDSVLEGPRSGKLSAFGRPCSFQTRIQPPRK
jgi:hypothetical protein